MSFLHPSILYIHLYTFFKIIYLNCFKHFGIRRFIGTLLFVVLFTLLMAIVTVGRLLDEILFFRYRWTDFKQPVFIIANPRSGTTYLHRLMSLDEERYIYTLLFQTLFASVTILKLIDVMGWVDRRIGRPFRKFFDWIDGKVFDGWKDIHPMGINQTEEDEGMYVFPMITPAICLLCPYMEEFKYLTIPDKNLSQKHRKRMSKYYESSMKRFAYARGKDKIILSKNVLSTGRLKTVLEVFPDARIIYLIRNPKKAVPSFISMFALPWKVTSPDIPENSIHHQALGQVAMDFYTYFHEIKDELKQENLYTIRYEDFVKSPKESVLAIYESFGMPVSDAFLQRIEQETNKQRKYRSKHHYSLEQYGMTEEQVEVELKEVLEEYWF